MFQIIIDDNTTNAAEKTPDKNVQFNMSAMFPSSDIMAAYGFDSFIDTKCLNWC